MQLVSFNCIGFSEEKSLPASLTEDIKSVIYVYSRANRKLAKMEWLVVGMQL